MVSKPEQNTAARGFADPTLKSIAELIAEQGVQPVVDISSLSGAIPDEDLELFMEGE